MPLVIRPTPDDGEAPIGFLHRVARANGYLSVGQLYGVAQVDGVAPMDVLFGMLGCPPHVQQLLCGMAPGRWGFSKDVLGLEAGDFNWLRKRWCPECLKERPGIFAGAWTQKLACCCISHAVWLQDVCSWCGSAQPWSGTNVDGCYCGAKLCESKSQHVPKAVVNLTAALQGITLWPPHEASCFAHLSVKELHRLVRYLGRFGVETRPGKVGKISDLADMAIARPLVSGAAHLLGSWSANFVGLLEDLQQGHVKDPSLRRTFAPLYKVLYELLPEPGYQFMRDAFEDYLHEHWWGLVCKRNKRLKSATVKAHPRLTVAQAAAATDASSTTIKRLVQSERVEGSVAALPSGRTTTSVLFRELAELADEVRGCLTLAEAASSLQVGERRVRHLIEQGVLPTLTGERARLGFARWLIPRQGLESLFFCPHACPDDQKVIFVRQVFKYWQLSDVEGVALVQALQDGTLKSVGAVTAKTPLGMVILNRSAALDWLNLYRASRATHLSIPQVAMALSLKQQVVYELVSRTLLLTVRGQHAARLVTMTALADFKSTYISLGVLSSRLGTSPRVLLQKLTASPICGPTIDGARQYFYLRQDVGNLLGEAADEPGESTSTCRPR